MPRSTWKTQNVFFVAFFFVLLASCLFVSWFLLCCLLVSAFFLNFSFVREREKKGQHKREHKVKWVGSWKSCERESGQIHCMNFF